MLASKMLITTLKEAPNEAVIDSHILLLRAGMIRKLVAGVYNYMPLGLRTLHKIEAIIREEMDNAGGLEILSSALQPKELWEESGRWYKYGPELMRLKDRHDREFCLGPTHEEIFTDLIRNVVKSSKNLPINVYQIQTKYRDELRPRFGLMRGREFIMKDLYTFSTSQEDLDEWYNKVRQAYINIFTRMGLEFRIVNASSGQIGGKSSEEFMALCEIGEDTIIYSDQSDFASNTELCDLEEGAPSPDGKGTIKHAKGIELGHIFKLGTKYSEPMNLMFIDVDNKKKPVIMGCYGIGVSRVLMAVLEQCNVDLKVLWPEEIAPFKIHVIPMDKQGTEGYEKAYELHNYLEAKGYEVLIDDRNESAGVKFNDADLIGSKYRIVVGRKIKEGIVELRNMETNETIEVLFDEIKNYNF